LPGSRGAIKWSRPFFEYRGAILGNVSAFKQHCSFGFWGEEIGMVLRKAKAAHDGAMGTLGRIRRVEDLPAEAVLLDWIRQAAAFIERGNYTSPIAARQRVVKPPKPARKMPAEFAAALQKNKKAATAFEAFSPSCRREYIEWIAEAKRPETREKRIETAVEWIAEGKQRNWKYQKG
jgi:Bacteriocin-protection, YdeI or OmpD-Associated